MRVAISAMGNRSGDLLDIRFGRCEAFLIYDTETGQYLAEDNPAKSEGQGAGINAAQAILDKNIDVLITGRLGPNAFEIFASSDVEVYTSESLPVETVVEKYKNNELQKLEGPGISHAGLKDGRGGKNRYRGR